MKLTDFIKDRGMLLLLHLVCMCAAAAFFTMTGYSRTNTVLFLLLWLLVLMSWLLATYLRRRRFFQEAQKILEKVDQRYLLGELLPDSFYLEDRLYRDMILRSNKQCIERIRQIEDEQRAYKEYIESWVHEIKAPITGISLLCDNRRSASASLPEDKPGFKESYLAINLENQKIENYVDMALYYARSDQVYKDYLIRETCLEDVVYQILDKNRLLLIQNRVRVQTDCKETVYTDEKWIAFILNQILLNSVKYRSESPLFNIRANRDKDGVTLLLEDNGPGIPPEDLPRIFDKGFTGSNGRDNRRSTGMGLYLCRRLCERLGIRLWAESEYAVGTKLYLRFPVNSYIHDARKN